MARTVLFLCSGNYYRSRYAEAVFNVLAETRALDWRAWSRGLMVDGPHHNMGQMSMDTYEALRRRGLDPQPYLRFPLQVSNEELASATQVIAMKEAEHRAMLATRYPDWADRVSYWHVHDLDGSPQAEAFAAIDEHVTALLDQLVG